MLANELSSIFYCVCLVQLLITLDVASLQILECNGEMGFDLVLTFQNEKCVKSCEKTGFKEVNTGRHNNYSIKAWQKSSL